MFIRKHFTTESLVLEASPFNRELAMESYILDNPSVLALNLKEFNDVTILTSELTLLNAGSNKKGKTDGRIDILANYDSEYLAIVELKKGMLIRKHFEQLQNYLKEKTQILEKGKKQLGLDLWDESLSGPPKWIGVMIGESIEPELMLTACTGSSISNQRTA